MRRAYALLVVPLLAVAAIAGCSSPSSSKSASSSSSSASSTANQSVSVTGDFGSTPTVTIPAEKAGADLYSKTVIQGSGAPLTTADSFVANFALYVWSGTTHKLATTTYGKTSSANTPTLLPSDLLTGLSKALIGAKDGSRVLAVIPPADGFGSSGNSELGITGTDTLVFVVDLVKNFPNAGAASGSHVSGGGGSLPTVSNPAAGTAPTVTIPKNVNPPKDLTVTTLLKGTGPKLTKGQYVIVQYTGVIWRTGKVFGSSYESKTPFGFMLDASPEQVISGWDKGLVGQTVGSRVMLTVPPSDGYGSSGQSTAGIKGTDTLVFVVDILGTA
jgi:FKBP-type peptidyl-prolyl cis-trans isomerase